MRPRGGNAPSPTPLRDEWLQASFDLWLAQQQSKPLSVLPFALMPESREFNQLCQGCTKEATLWKFDQLRGLTPRALRAEVGSALRLLLESFGSPAFVMRCQGKPFDFGGFLQSQGILIIERGNVISAEAASTIMGAIILKTIEHVKRRPIPSPPILLVIEEANNAGLLGRHESQALAETRKYGLFIRIVVQTPTFPPEIEANVLQNCNEKHWMRCGSYEVARKAAQDIAAGFSWLASSDISRAETIAQLTTELLHFDPGWRYVRTPAGSRKEFIPLLRDPWTWPSLQAPKLKEKMARIYARPEYAGRNETRPSSTSSANTLPPQNRSPESSSPADRWKRRERRPTDDSTGFAEDA